ncbi:ORF6C domain-containing protein [Otariodibacter oris]|uniref:ORF6C domain-containing protein n=1 Tax=Otariodibacter oris TaxID=1032623 RepID=A0A420XIJ9_9PAST|nr:ORF6C domain-containing protein [Otariodibacter oris]QGM80696.1 transcriptional regulator [Otariodibacter oris]RKR77142.1 ORF6C domain-containing protein [Otariodibacter oris]
MDMTITKEDMGIRLVEERTRLGYSQASFAHQTEINRETLRLNELGRSGMSAEFLGRAAQLGVDIQYVITGIRSITHINKNKESGISQNVDGNNNNVIYGEKGVINNITTEKHVTRTKAIVEPDNKHINEEMARTLKDLVNEVVNLENELKKQPKTFQAVWASLNKHCGVTTYKLIPIEKYEKAENYLRKWIGRLNSSKSAPKKIGNDWRKRKYSYIHINVKKLDLELWLREYLQERYCVGSITELSNDQLDALYHNISSKLSSYKRKQAK